MVDDKGLLKRDLADDGLHPNAAGYKMMAPLAEARDRVKRFPASHYLPPRPVYRIYNDCEFPTALACRISMAVAARSEFSRAAKRSRQEPVPEGAEGNVCASRPYKRPLERKRPPGFTPSVRCPFSKHLAVSTQHSAGKWCLPRMSCAECEYRVQECCFPTNSAGQLPICGLRSLIAAITSVSTAVRETKAHSMATSLLPTTCAWRACLWPRNPESSHYRRRAAAAQGRDRVRSRTGELANSQR